MMMTTTRNDSVRQPAHEAMANPEDQQIGTDFDPTDFQFGTDGEYGQDDAIAALTANLSEGSPVTQLSALLDELAELLREADVKRLCRPPSLLERFSGRALERHLEHIWARIRLENLAKKGDPVARMVECTIEQLDALLAAENRAMDCRRLHLRAGRLHLARFFQITERDQGSLPHDAGRERLQRRLAYLQVAIASMEINAVQIRLARANAADLLARYYEFSRLLLPQWFKQIALLNLNDRNAQDQIKAVNHAYQTARALLQSPERTSK